MFSPFHVSRQVTSSRFLWLLRRLGTFVLLCSACQPGAHRSEPQAPPTGGGPTVEADPKPEAAGRQGTPIVAMYNDGGMTLEPRVILLVWKDGRAVWSGSWLEGGPPYHEGKVVPEAVENILAGLERRGIFQREYLNRNNFGPDARYTVIDISDGSRRLSMKSWHELYEGNDRVVGTSGGLSVIPEGRTREEILDQEPQEYRDYRRIWSEIRESFRKLVPAEGRITHDVTFRPR